MGNESDPKQELEEAIFEAQERTKSEIKERRNYFITGLFFSALLIAHYTKYPLPFYDWIIVVIWVLAVCGYLAALGSDVAKERGVYEKLVFRKELLYGIAKSTNQSDSHFDSLVNINIENLAEYYRLVKIHTQKSFTASLCVALFGFALISAGLIIVFTSKEYSQLAYMSTASGIVVEFISASFFYLYSKTVRQLKGYHDSLIDVQNMLLSFRLIDATEAPENKVKLVEKMIDYLASNKSNVT